MYWGNEHAIALWAQFHTFMSEGNRSRWVKYDGSAVWKPAAAMEREVRTALSRRATVGGQRETGQLLMRLTASATADDGVERGHEVGHDGVGIVQAGEDGKDVRARVGVLLAEGGFQEDCQGLGR